MGLAGFDEATEARAKRVLAAIAVVGLGGLLVVITGGLAIAGFFLLVGLGMLWAGIREYRQRQLVENTPTSSIRSMAAGAVEIEGQARPFQGPTTSPLTGRDVCLYELEVRTAGGDSSQKELVLRGPRAFLVDDGTGQARVEPEQARIDLEDGETRRVDADEEPPKRLQDWVQAQGGLEALEGSVAYRRQEGALGLLLEARSGPRFFVERVLGPGESCYVFGSARVPAAAEGDELVVRRHEGTGRFLVADRPEPEVLDAWRDRSLFFVALGVFLTAAMAAVLVRTILPT